MEYAFHIDSLADDSFSDQVNSSMRGSSLDIPRGSVRLVISGSNIRSFDSPRTLQQHWGYL